VGAARALPRDFVLVARADGLMTGSYGLDEAIRRIRAFAEAGADCVYIPLLPNLATVARVCAAVPVPVNVLAVGPLTALSRGDLAGAGAAWISLGSALARVTHGALIEAAREVLGAGDFHRLATGAKGSAVDALLAQGGRG
jgi:2-methylisocitrate lyase-like PEP mutase family enzyme